MNRLFVSCAALMLLASPAFAAQTVAPQTAQSAGGAQGMRRGVFEQADANNDGVITKEEFVAAEGKYFDTVDANHDGKLTKDEVQAQRQKSHDRITAWRQQRQETTGNAGAGSTVNATGAAASSK